MMSLLRTRWPGLVHEVEREVGVVLEDADLPRLLEAHAAGAQVGDAAVLELEAGVGDVLGLRQHLHAHAVDPPDRRLHEGQHDADVVDHEVEHDADLGAAQLVGRQPLGGDEPRAAHLLLEEGHHRVEVLHVAHLDEAALRAGPRRPPARPPPSRRRAASRSGGGSPARAAGGRPPRAGRSGRRSRGRRMPRPPPRPSRNCGSRAARRSPPARAESRS